MRWWVDCRFKTTMIKENTVKPAIEDESVLDMTTTTLLSRFSLVSRVVMVWYAQRSKRNNESDMRSFSSSSALHE